MGLGLDIWIEDWGLGISIGMGDWDLDRYWDWGDGFEDWDWGFRLVVGDMN